MQAQTLKAITHNICGGCLPGNLEPGIDPTIAEIQSWQPDVVMLQEVCYEQFEYLADQLAADYSAVFINMRATSRCARGTPGEDLRNGQVIAARGPITGRDEIDLGGDSYDVNGRHFTALCYDVTVTGFGENGVKSCVTHNRAFANVVGERWHDRGRWAQHSKLASEMDDDLYEDGQVVILGGDFNAEPDRPTMDPIYRLNHNGSPTGVGEFVEADQDDASYFTGGCTTACRTGQPTSHSGRKIDYVFFGSAEHEIVDVSGGVIESTVADHNLYRGLAELVPYEPVTIADFDDAGNWEPFWVRAEGTGEPTSSGHNGTTGLRLTYDFPELDQIRSVGAWAPGRAIAIAGAPEYVTLWVNSEEGRGERPRMQFLDGNGEILTVQANHLYEPGWQQLAFRIPPGTTYPLTFQRVYFQETSAVESYESALVMDELAAWVTP